MLKIKLNYVLDIELSYNYIICRFVTHTIKHEGAVKNKILQIGELLKLTWLATTTRNSTGDVKL